MPPAVADKPPVRAWSFGPLYDLMFQTFPDCRSKQGLFDVPKFAKLNGVTHESAYKWFRKNKLPAERVKPLVELSQGKLTPETLILFVI